MPDKTIDKNGKQSDPAQEQSTPINTSSGGFKPFKELPVFDRQTFHDRLMNDEDLIKEITALFLENTPGQIQALKEFINQGDANMARKQAHTIKGAAANVGGLALSALASRMEKTSNLKEIADWTPELERQFDLLKAQMMSSKP
jgi:HPt (histidine-containing phosphotransfer) domain-containing protein